MLCCRLRPAERAHFPSHAPSMLVSGSDWRNGVRNRHLRCKIPSRTCLTGSKAVKLRTSKCFPICPRKRTSDLRVNEYTPFCNGPGDVKSPRVIVASPSSRFCPWSTLRPPHCAVRLDTRGSSDDGHWACNGFCSHKRSQTRTAREQSSFSVSRVRRTWQGDFRFWCPWCPLPAPDRCRHIGLWRG